MNLAINARDAMPDGGELRISVADGQPGQLVLAISDTGIGMDAAVMSRMFEPFFTTKPKGRGTGLGLATVYGIVEQSGGTLAVESEPGKGSTFRVAFPRAEGPTPFSSAKPSRTSRPDIEASVLVVEDDPLVRGLLNRVLDRAGYHVTIAKTPAEALEVVRAHAMSIDLLITDIMLPEMNGRQLAERVVDAYPAAKVLFMSGYTEDPAERANGADTLSWFIHKPFTPDSLARKVREVLVRQ
jgi:two-component system, cell cycle sensor histidine kinase and response regulator CckA